MLRIAASIVAGLTAGLLFVAVAKGTEIIDQRGQRVQLATPASRVVFLPMPAPALFVSIDETAGHIVGMNPSSKLAMRGGVMERMFPGLDAISTDIVRGAGVTPNVESILSLNPDVVFQWATSGEDASAVLDHAGLKVLGMRYGTQDDAKGYAVMMGRVAGKEARALELNRRQDEREAFIESMLRDLPAKERPRVLYLGRFSDALSVSGAGSYNDFYIRLAGGDNAATSLPGSGRVVTFEEILALNPDVILLGNFDAAMPANLYDDPRWQDVAAVKTHRVYRMPLGGYRWDPPSQESALTWTWLAALLHSDRAKINMRADMRDWYRFLYNHDLTDDEIDKILFVTENRRSVGYERFSDR